MHMADCSQQLCALLSRSLLPSSQSQVSEELISITKEKEKNLLLSLTSVSRLIQKWIDSPDSDDNNWIQHFEQHLQDSHNCIANIVSLLVALLVSDCQSIHHLSGNILVLCSDYISEHGNRWDDFVHLLWTSLEAAILSICSSATLSSSLNIIRLDGERLKVYDASVSCIKSYIALSQSRLVTANWPMVSSLFIVLRNILKSLRNNHEELEEIYTNIAVYSLLEMPWDAFIEVYFCHTSMGQTTFNKDDSSKVGEDLSRSKDVVLGSMLQFFCSLVEQKDPEADENDLLKNLSVYCRFTNLIPKIFSCCFTEKFSCSRHLLTPYFKHKALLLMRRLTFHKHWQKTGPLQWMNLVREYFEDLVFQPISNCQAESVDSLEDSPFVPCLSEGESTRSISRRHLQRQALFVFLKSCFTLLGVSSHVSQECMCTSPVSSSTHELHMRNKDCLGNVYLELWRWLEECVFLEMSADHETCSRACSSFAFSFLQLFMEEDDVLFQMLLQLPDSHVLTGCYREVAENVLFHMSSIFNPIHLFHYLLFLLHYDHLVLVDYLISKDVGIDCIQYLLRCLRLICKSWTTFVEFFITQGEASMQQNKRRKVYQDEKECSQEAGCSMSFKIQKQVISKGSQSTISLQTFENAKECLLRLKRTVENLHKKKLFPYNPTPLLKSLSRFKDLCLE